MDIKATLILTSRGLYGSRRLRAVLRAAVPSARIRSTGFRGAYLLEADADADEMADKICRECADRVGHLAVVLGDGALSPSISP